MRFTAVILGFVLAGATAAVLLNAGRPGALQSGTLPLRAPFSAVLFVMTFTPIRSSREPTAPRRPQRVRTTSA